MRGLLLSVALLAPGVAAAEVTLPSGQSVEPFDTLTEEQAGLSVLILRYVAPQIDRETGTVDVAAASLDLDHLCATDGLDLASDEIDQIVVTLMSQALPRGQTNPDVTQFFGLYSIEDGTCIWEPF